MVQSGVRTPNAVFFFYFFGIGVSFVLDGAWLHEVPAPDNAGVAVGEGLAPPEYGGGAVNFLITLSRCRPRGSDDMPPAADDIHAVRDDIQHPRVLMIYNTHGR